MADDADEDSDDGGRYYRARVEDDDARMLSDYGHRPDGAVNRQLEEVVKRYYRYAVASDGGGGCSLLVLELARSLVSQQARSSGSTDVDCGRALSRFFAYQHRQLLARRVRAMQVIDSRAHGGTALVILGFPDTPEAQILLMRESGLWKVDALMDSVIP